MKKLVFAMVTVSLVVSAHGWGPPPPPHHHWRGDCRDAWVGAAVGFGVGTLAAGLFAPRRETVVVTPTYVQPTVVTPTVVTTPVYTPPVVTTINPNLPAFYQDPIPAPVRALPPAAYSQTTTVTYQQPARTWVPGQYVNQVQAIGSTVQIWVPGHFQ